MLSGLRAHDLHGPFRGPPPLAKEGMGRAIHGEHHTCLTVKCQQAEVDELFSSLSDKNNLAGQQNWEPPKGRELKAEAQEGLSQGKLSRWGLGS